MQAYRKTPNFYGKDKPLPLYLGGVFALLIGLCVFASIFSAKNSFLDYSFGCVFGPFIVFFILVGVVFMFHEGSSIQKERRSWFDAADTAQTTIIDRQEIDNDPRDIEYASGYGQVIPAKYWYLKLEIIPAQLAIKPEEILVSVSVDESQYKRYVHKNTVRIYYSKEDPFVFLLEDEV